MCSQSKTYLAAVMALLLAGACSDSGAKKQELDPSTDDDDGEQPEDETGEDAERDARAPTGLKDATVPTVPKPSDSGTVQPEDAGSTTVVDATMPGPDGGGSTPTPTADGMCCDDGDCLCHGDAPTALTADKGPYKTMSYALAGAGCVHYPTDAEGPFAAVAISDGFGGSGGCGALSQTGNWGPLYASWGIVAMIIDTTGGDQPNTRGQKLTKGIAAFKTENTKSGSPLEGKLSGRYGTSGFSMGGGGTSYSSAADDTLKSSVAIMPWGPVRTGVKVPTLVICGSSDTIAPCGQHGNPLYRGIADSVPKMRVVVSSSHLGQPSAGGNNSGKYGLAFTKVFLENDQRWKPLLTGIMAAETNIK